MYTVMAAPSLPPAPQFAATRDAWRNRQQAQAPGPVTQQDVIKSLQLEKESAETKLHMFAGAVHLQRLQFETIKILSTCGLCHEPFHPNDQGNLVNTINRLERSLDDQHRTLTRSAVSRKRHQCVTRLAEIDPTQHKKRIIEAGIPTYVNPAAADNNRDTGEEEDPYGSTETILKLCAQNSRKMGQVKRGITGVLRRMKTETLKSQKCVVCRRRFVKDITGQQDDAKLARFLRMVDTNLAAVEKMHIHDQDS